MDKIKSMMHGSQNKEQSGSASDKGSSSGNKFNFDRVLNAAEPELSKKLHLLIKSEGHIIDAYEAAGRERGSYGHQLHEWGQGTEDDTIAVITQGLGELYAEVAESEDRFATELDEGRTVLKTIRNLERDVGRSRQKKDKLAVKLEETKQKEPESTKVRELEQELTRAEADTIVANTQISNVTREKVKASYDIQLAAMIERAEKQLIIAKHGRQLLQLLDDTPVQPDQRRQPFAHTDQVRHIVVEAKEGVESWHPTHEPIHSNVKGTSGIAHGSTSMHTANKEYAMNQPTQTTTQPMTTTGHSQFGQNEPMPTTGHSQIGHNEPMNTTGHSQFGQNEPTHATNPSSYTTAPPQYTSTQPTYTSTQPTDGRFASTEPHYTTSSSGQPMQTSTQPITSTIEPVHSSTVAQPTYTTSSQPGNPPYPTEGTPVATNTTQTGLPDRTLPPGTAH